MSCGILQAQIYSTSSSTFHSISTTGVGAVTPNEIGFRSTSIYSKSMPNDANQTFSAAPMNVAKGTIKTIASTISGGVWSVEENTGFIPTHPQRAPGVPVPIGEGWDVVLLLVMLCGGYVVRRYISVKRLNGRKTEVKASEMR